MKKNHSIFLEHILQSINLIEEYTKEKTKDDFLKSVALQSCSYCQIHREARRTIPACSQSASARTPHPDFGPLPHLSMPASHEPSAVLCMPLRTWSCPRLSTASSKEACGTFSEDISVYFAPLCKRHRWINASLPKRSVTALARALEPSKTNRYALSVDRPRRIKSSSNAPQTSAFSVAPGHSPARARNRQNQRLKPL